MRSRRLLTFEASGYIWAVKPLLRIICCIFALVLCSSWGFYAHSRINRLAVFTLPPAMAGFYLSNIDYLTAHAISADKRRYVDSSEAPHHFLNADHYGKHPFRVIPENWDDAAIKYSADTLVKYGTLPWTIEYQYYRLVRAFKAHDTTAILKTSANLGHYIADAHVPLHLTENYNGQLTGQQGIHALWESRIPELFSSHYRLYCGRARYIENPLAEAFRICRTSYREADSVLRIEKNLSKWYPAGKKYATIVRGNRQLTDYSPAYAAAYQRMLHGMVERRMRSAILAVGSFWFSAWVDAGQPDLNKLIKQSSGADVQKNLRHEEYRFKTGKTLVLATGNEDKSSSSYQK